MTDPIIERLRAIEAKINGLGPGALDTVNLYVSPRRVFVRNFGLLEAEAEGVTIEEAVTNFEATVARVLNNRDTLAKTLGLEAAE